MIQVENLDALHRELHGKTYPFMNPGIETRGYGREVTVLDPASNQVRFFQAGESGAED
jgi:hypothetical protein